MHVIVHSNFVYCHAVLEVLKWKRLFGQWCRLMLSCFLVRIYFVFVFCGGGFLCKTGKCCTFLLDLTVLNIGNKQNNAIIYKLSDDNNMKIQVNCTKWNC